MNDVFKALLNENRKAPQLLHELYGFDFQKEFFITKQTHGPLTYNAATKQIPNSIKKDEYKAVVLLHIASEYDSDTEHSLDSIIFAEPEIDNHFKNWFKRSEYGRLFVIRLNDDRYYRPYEGVWRRKENGDKVEPRLEPCVKEDLWIRYLEDIHSTYKPENIMGMYKAYDYSDYTKQEYEEDRKRNVGWYYLIAQAEDNMIDAAKYSFPAKPQDHLRLLGERLNIYKVAKARAKAKTIIDKMDISEDEKRICERIQQTKQALANQLCAAQTKEDYQAVYTGTWALHMAADLYNRHKEYLAYGRYDCEDKVKSQLRRVEILLSDASNYVKGA